MTNQSEKITILGGSGFVGTNLCTLLKKANLDFEIIDIKKSKKFPLYCKIGDIRDIDSMRALITGKTVVHLAAIHKDNVVDPNVYYNTNVQGTSNVAQICLEKNIKKFIFTSTVAVYGFAKPNTNENGCLQPFNHYGKSKLEAERLLKEIFSNDALNISLSIIRPTVIFGSGNRGNVFNLINQIALGRFLMIGSGLNKKSLAFIENFVHFIVQCIKDERFEGTHNYVDKPDMTMNELTHLINVFLKKERKIKIRIPVCLGLAIGYVFDFLSICLRKEYPISSIRVKKFCSNSTFSSNEKSINERDMPYTLIQGLEKTIKKEFLDKNKPEQVFYTE